MAGKLAVLIAGPTASGKSALALELAQASGGIVINADSMQVYRDLHVITARPSAAEEARVPHRLYGHIDAAVNCSAGRWVTDAAAALSEARAQDRLPIFTGGSGLYFKSLTRGLSAVPPVPAAIREAIRARLEHNGVEVEVVYPECCGMPQLEHGEIADVVGRAKRTAALMKPWIEKGYQVVAPVPSCALMLRSEWPLLVPGDAEIAALAAATRDVSEYVMDIAGKEGLMPGIKPLEGGAWLQLSCHARAQNVGAKAAEMLRLIPGFQVGVIERCSGHGGSWGVLKENFEVALKVGKPVARQIAETPRAFVASECPLAAEHVAQGARIVAEQEGGTGPTESHHPIEILARAYGLGPERHA